MRVAALDRILYAVSNVHTAKKDRKKNRLVVFISRLSIVHTYTVDRKSLVTFPTNILNISHCGILHSCPHSVCLVTATAAHFYFVFFLVEFHHSFLIRIHEIVHSNLTVIEKFEVFACASKLRSICDNIWFSDFFYFGERQSDEFR